MLFHQHTLRIMTTQALMHARNFGPSCHYLKNGNFKLFRIFLAGDYCDQNSLGASGLEPVLHEVLHLSLVRHYDT